MNELIAYFALNENTEKKEYEAKIDSLTRLDTLTKKMSEVTITKPNYAPNQTREEEAYYDKVANEFLGEVPELEIPELNKDIRELLIQPFDNGFALIIPSDYTHYRVILKQQEGGGVRLKIKCDYPLKANYDNIFLAGEMFKEIINKNGIISLLR